MNAIQKRLFFLVLVLTLNLIVYAQSNSSNNELRFEVNMVSPSNTISNESLNEAQTLEDLNRFYRPSWVRDYISVEIATSHQGKIKKAINKDDTLSSEQKSNMQQADKGSTIFVNVNYIPENNLKENRARNFDFSFVVHPETKATFKGGQQDLTQYLQKNAMEKIPAEFTASTDLSAIKFTVNEEGEITNAQIFDEIYQSGINEKVSEILLAAVQKMPCWQPAEYSNGVTVKQDFVLTVGNMKSCIINLLDIKDPPPVD